MLFATISSSLLAVSCGLHFGWTSPAIPKLLRKELQFEVNLTEISYIVMIGNFGYFISGPICALVLDKIGRKLSLLLLCIPQIVAWLLISNALCVEMLYLSRIISGAAEGIIFTVLPMYICEISEPDIRGGLGSFFTFGLNLGILLINCYGSFISLELSAYISISIAVLFMITFIWMSESPYYLLMVGCVEDARISLQNLRKMQNVDKELFELTADVERQTSEQGTYKEIFTILANLKSFLILLGLRTLQQFSGYYAFNYYTQVIFENAGAFFSPAVNSIIYTSFNLLFTFVGVILLDLAGRRIMLIISLTGVTIFLFVEALYFCFDKQNYDMSNFSWVPLTGMILYSFCFNVGLGVVPNLLTGELFSVSVKSKALGVLIFYCALGVAASNKLFQFLKDEYGTYIAFTVFGCITSCGIVFSYYCVPETKGKTLEQIQTHLRD